MTIFDLIRYPITDIYNIDQLNALPETVFKQWMNSYIKLNQDTSSNYFLSRSNCVLVFLFQYINRNNDPNCYYKEISEDDKNRSLKVLKEILYKYNSDPD